MAMRETADDRTMRTGEGEPLNGEAAASIQCCAETRRREFDMPRGDRVVAGSARKRYLIRRVDDPRLFGAGEPLQIFVPALVGDVGTKIAGPQIAKFFPRFVAGFLRDEAT